jgi:hypothetical protein
MIVFLINFLRQKEKSAEVEAPADISSVAALRDGGGVTHPALIDV